MNREIKYRTLSQWLEIFPEAKDYCRYKYDKLNKERENLKGRAKRALRIISDWKGKWFWKMYINEFLGKRLKRLSNELNRLRWALTPKSFKKGQEITPEAIERARNYPIAELFGRKWNKYWVECPFHEDQHPSGYIKNNYFYCFGCGKQMDTIDILMERDGATFKQAIKHLSK